MEEIEKLKEVVDKLNETLWGEYSENSEFTDTAFAFVYATGIQLIEFEDEVLWSSAAEERTFIEEINDYEDLYAFVVKRFCKSRYINYKMARLFETEKNKINGN